MKYLIMLAALLVALAPTPAPAASVGAQISAIHDMEDNALTRLYRESPATRDEIRQAVGYAVFSSGEIAVLWVSAGFGHGVAHDNTDGKETFMKMARAGVGVGLGAKDFNTIFVFNNREAYNSFVTTGLDLSGTADAAAKSGTSGAAVSGAANIMAGVRVYQLTNTGLLAQAMLQGTKYWRDDELSGEKVSSVVK
jgi:lipid-binding SYLF domain-containing protein